MSLLTDSILEKLNSLIVVVNPQGGIEYVSPSAQRILGFEPEQLIGEGWWNLTRDNENDRQDVMLKMRELEKGSSLNFIPYERYLKLLAGSKNVFCGILPEVL